MRSSTQGNRDAYIRIDAPLKSERIRKLEQVSAKRFHNEILIDSPPAVEREVITWLKIAYALGVGAG